MNTFILAAHLVAIIVISFFVRRLGSVALTCFVVLQTILANLFVLKQINVCGFDATCSDVFSVGAMISLNMLQEDYDAKSSKQAVLLSFAFMLFFVTMSWIHLQYIPAEQDGTYEAYSAILGMTPRLMIASIVTTLISQGIDVKLFGLLKQLLPKRGLPLRSGLSALISQAVDTALFTFLGLYGFVANPVDIFLVSYVIKIGITFTLLYAIPIRNTAPI